jgi:hypothetical protein
MSNMVDVAMVSGVIGAVTGVVALVVSIKTYINASAMKALDLRLELERTFNNLDIVLSGIDGYLDFARDSHLRVLAATGRNQSGEMQLFEEEFANDKTRLRRLLSSQPKREGNPERLSAHDLEKVLATTHAFHLQLADLRGKYQKLLDADEVRRKEVREDWQRIQSNAR